MEELLGDLVDEVRVLILLCTSGWREEWSSYQLCWEIQSERCVFSTQNMMRIPLLTVSTWEFEEWLGLW